MNGLLTRLDLLMMNMSDDCDGDDDDGSDDDDVAITNDNIDTYTF